jgi:uncharacterized protein YjiS (DUF1127 family)
MLHLTVSKARCYLHQSAIGSYNIAYCIDTKEWIMREYAVFEAQSDGVSLLGGIRRLFTNWRKRRQLRQLLDLDDYVLNDIGFNRADVLSAMQLALYVDPLAELERRSRGAARRGVRHG